MMTTLEVKKVLKQNGASKKDLIQLKSANSLRTMDINKRLWAFVISEVSGEKDEIAREIMLGYICNNKNVSGKDLEDLSDIVIEDINRGRIPLSIISTLMQRKDIELDKKIEISYALKERREDVWYNLLQKLSESGEESIKALFSL